MPCWISVAVHTPAHSRLGGLLSYQADRPLPPGTLVRVPLGKRETLGVVWGDLTESDLRLPDGRVPEIKAIAAAFDALAPLDAHWRALIAFTASYYQRSLGEVALAALPPALKDLDGAQLARRLKRAKDAAPGDSSAPGETRQLASKALNNSIAHSDEQRAVMADLDTQSGPFLLFGATGSGKTEVYLHAVQTLLDADPTAQALVMVPEINLTPQLEARFTERFAPRYGAAAVVAMHSGMTNPQRLQSWLSAHRGPNAGGARIILGTRMAIMASMPNLRLIVVDEEHDPSYKSQDGARFSARDLAVYRGRQTGAKVILGSATPSLESWHHSRDKAEGGRYQRLHMPSRIGAGSDNISTGLPQVRLVDMTHQPSKTIFSAPLLQAITERVARGEQAMVFLNRRGYAPVLHCDACGWKSECLHCSAHRVFHKIDRTLRCHHCGFTERVPRACPDCGNIDVSTVGKGTEQIEEHLTALFAEVLRPDGKPARVARIDADSTRLKGELGRQLAEVHAGEVDIVVGTQMIAKGHDFRRITLVAAINPDGALFSADYRAPERLFSLLMQAAGRAGRAASHSAGSEMWLQTAFPAHPLFQALKRHDYPGFAQDELAERLRAGMPPYSYQALVRAEAKTQDLAQAFLNSASAAAAELDAADHVTRYPSVPMTIQRIANVERAQMLIESPSRVALQRFLQAWHGVLHSLRAEAQFKPLIRWAVDVDPLSV
jgi:primosomal protein N' (replication factor Y) (superfamily II helicase)